MSKKAKERKHHKEFPPSSMPALDQCPSFRPGKAEGEAVTRGTELHAQFEELLKRKDKERCQK